MIRGKGQGSLELRPYILFLRVRSAQDKPTQLVVLFVKGKSYGERSATDDACFQQRGKLTAQIARFECRRCLHRVRQLCIACLEKFAPAYVAEEKVSGREAPAGLEAATGPSRSVVLEPVEVIERGFGTVELLEALVQHVAEVGLDEVLGAQRLCPQDGRAGMGQLCRSRQGKPLQQVRDEVPSVCRKRVELLRYRPFELAQVDPAAHAE